MTSTRSCTTVQKLASLIPSPDRGSVPTAGDAHERAPRAVVSVKIGGTFQLFTLLRESFGVGAGLGEV
jgi:hypothetical protein